MAGIKVMICLSFALLLKSVNGQTFFTTNAGSIYSVDFSSCTESLVCSGSPLISLSYFNGMFYGTGSVGSTNTLYSLNPTTCIATPINSSTPSLNINGLVADGNGNLYASLSGSSNIYCYNISSDTWSLVGSVTGFSSAGDLTFYNGKLYMVAFGNPNQLLEITLSPFSFVNIGNIGTTTDVIFGTITSIPPGNCTGEVYAFIENAGNMSIGTVDPSNGNVTTVCSNFFTGTIMDGASIEETGLHLAMNASPFSVCSGDPTTLTAQGGYTTYNWSGPGLSSTSGISVVATPTTTSTYTVTASFTGCTNTASITIQMLPSINASVSCSPLSPCGGDLITLSSLPTATIIPIISEDFETGNSFTIANGPSNNRWTQNTGTEYAGSYSLYIYYSAPTTYGANGNPSTCFAYKDIDITGTSVADLTFYWKNAGANPNATLTVWKVPTTQTFSPGSPGTGLTTGAGRDLLGTFTGSATYQLATINLLPYSGQTIRLVFQWRNAAMGVLASPASVDDISLTQISNNSFNWSSSPAGFTSGVQNPSTTAVANTTYTVTISNSGMCPGTATVTVGNCGLPVEFLSAYGVVESDGNRIIWETATETNNAYFSIERSVSQSEFETIGFIAGAGSSNSLIRYEFFDTNPYELNYYRIRQTDYNGSSEVSPVFAVNRQYAVQPEITVNESIISVSNLGASSSIKVFNQAGLIVFSGSTTEKQIEIETSNFGQGVFSVVLFTDGQQYSEKVPLF